jgi:EpsI family protein
MPAAVDGIAVRSAAAGLLPVVAATILVGAIWPAFAAWRAGAVDPRPVNLAAPAIAAAPALAFSSWSPDYMKPDAGFNGVYASSDNAVPVGVRILYYRNQQKNKSLVSSINHIAGEHNDFGSTASTGRLETINGKTLPLRETRLRNGKGKGAAALLVWQWDWIDQRVTANAYQGKLWQARAKLTMQPDDGAAVMISAPLGDDPEQTRATMRAFLQANLGAIDAALAQTRSR